MIVRKVSLRGLPEGRGHLYCTQPCLSQSAVARGRSAASRTRLRSRRSAVVLEAPGRHFDASPASLKTLGGPRAGPESSLTQCTHWQPETAAGRPAAVCVHYTPPRGSHFKATYRTRPRMHKHTAAAAGRHARRQLATLAITEWLTLRSHLETLTLKSHTASSSDGTVTI